MRIAKSYSVTDSRIKSLYQQNYTKDKIIKVTDDHLIFVNYLIFMVLVQTHTGEWFQKLSLEEMLAIKLNDCETLNLSN